MLTASILTGRNTVYEDRNHENDEDWLAKGWCRIRVREVVE